MLVEDSEDIVQGPSPEAEWEQSWAHSGKNTRFVRKTTKS